MRPVIGLSVDSRPPDDPGYPSRLGSIALGRAYIEAIRGTGGIPILLPYSQKEEQADLLPRLDGLLLTGGGDIDPALYGEAAHVACSRVIPERAVSEISMVCVALERCLPILGICLGLQTLNVALGGDLYQDIPSQTTSSLKHRQPRSERAEPAHLVEVVEGTLLTRVLGVTSVEVNSTHHQAARSIGRGLVVNARAPDGLIEGLEGPSFPFCLAVQWHPEDLLDRAVHRKLFESFVEAAAQFRSRSDAV